MLCAGRFEWHVVHRLEVKFCSSNRHDTRPFVGVLMKILVSIVNGGVAANAKPSESTSLELTERISGDEK